MARLNPLSFTPVETVTKSRDFTDDLQTGKTLSLTLTGDARGGARERRKDRAAALIAKYLTGDAEYVQSEGKSGTPPAGRPAPKMPGFMGEGLTGEAAYILLRPGQEALVTDRLCFVIATLTDMQEVALLAKYPDGKVPSDEKPYTFQEWVAIATNMPNAFEAAAAFVDEVLTEAYGLRKNGSGAAPVGETIPTTATSSEPPSEDASVTTPLSLPVVTRRPSSRTTPSSPS